MDSKQLQVILDGYKTGPRIAPGTATISPPHGPTIMPGDEVTDRGENREFRQDA
jgi:hypothetical protein